MSQDWQRQLAARELREAFRVLALFLVLILGLVAVVYIGRE